MRKNQKLEHKLANGQILRWNPERKCYELVKPDKYQGSVCKKS